MEINNKKIILASSNKDKLKQIKIYLDDLNLDIALPDYNIDIKEGDKSLKDNAIKKALEYSRQYKRTIILATDGGAKIPYLGSNWNHVMTKRLSGMDNNEILSNRQRCDRLLGLMKKAMGEQRKVFWRESYAIAFDNKIIFCEEFYGDKGYLTASIPDNFEEASGFWIGYLWYVPKFEKNYMALSRAQKKKLKSPGEKFSHKLKTQRILNELLK